PAPLPGRRRASPRHARSADRRRGLPRSRQPRQGPAGDLDRHAAPKRGGGDRLHPCGSGVATLLYAIPRAFLLLSAAAMLVACGTSSPGGNPYPGAERPANPQPTDPPAAAAPAHGGPPPEASAPTSAALNLRLLEKVSPSAGDGDLPVGPGDLIEISVFEVEELSKLRLRIPERGIISVPLIGHIQASGRTATMLEDEIRTRLEKKFMHNPQVAVFVHEHNSQRVTVMGAVRHGGVITLNRQLRLADALASAEGLADDADPVVYVIRRVPAGTLS